MRMKLIEQGVKQVRTKNLIVRKMIKVKDRNKLCISMGFKHILRIKSAIVKVQNQLLHQSNNSIPKL
jgi:hypothetical protein